MAAAGRPWPARPSAAEPRRHAGGPLAALPLLASGLGVNQERDGVVGEFERLALTERGGAVRVSVHARPRSSRSAILGVREAALDVALTAPPVDGEANAELVKLLARVLEVPKTAVRVIVGASGRSKIVEVAGLDAARARLRLSEAKR